MKNLQYVLSGFVLFIINAWILMLILGGLAIETGWSTAVSWRASVLLTALAWWVGTAMVVNWNRNDE